MSDEEGDNGLKSLIMDEVKDQLDVSALLGDGSIGDQLNGGEIGSSVGGQFGAQIGRELGEAIGREIHLTVAESIEDGETLSDMRPKLVSAIADGVKDAMTDIEGREALESIAQGGDDEGVLGGLLESDGETEELEVEDVSDEASEEAEAEEEEEPEEGEAEAEVDDEAADTAEESDETEDEEGEETEAEEGDKEEADEETEAETADGDETEDSDKAGEESEMEAEEFEGEPEELEEEREPATADLEGLERDTLEDFLGVMTYEDLQSVAKEVGVKANLSREEMTDKLIAQLSESDAEGEEAASSNGEDGEEQANEQDEEAEAGA